MNKVIKTVLGILLSVVLTVVIFMEGSFLFKTITKRNDDLYAATTNIAVTKAAENVSIEHVYTYADVDQIPDGDVVSVDGLTPHLQLCGVVSDKSDSDAGKIVYADKDNGAHTLNVEKRVNDAETLIKAMYSYYKLGTYADLYNAYGTPWQEEGAQKYSQRFNGYDYPIIYNGSTKNYYLFVEEKEEVFVVSSDLPVHLTNDYVTAHFKDPKVDVLKEHTYNFYEQSAAEATLKALESENKEGTVQPSAYSSDSVTGTSAAYTSAADDNIRKQMISYLNYKWDAKGYSDSTQLHLDITSEEALKSQWILTEKTYNYQHAGLTISSVKATRSASEFTISCNVNNTLNSERPMVIVFKYLNSNHELLGISALDYRSSPIPANGVIVCNSGITSAALGVDCDNIYAVQMEVY